MSETKVKEYWEHFFEKPKKQYNPYDIKEIKNKIEELNKNIIFNLKKNIKKYKENQNLYWEDNEKYILNFIKKEKR